MGLISKLPTMIICPFTRASIFFMKSAAATKADAPPPKPLNMATIWGIAVISTLAPMIIPIKISL